MHALGSVKHDLTLFHSLTVTIGNNIGFFNRDLSVVTPV